MNDTTSVPHAELNAIFERLRALFAEIRSIMNTNDRCVVIISAAITEGFDTRVRIIGTLKRIGFNPVQVVKILGDYEGTNRAPARWTVQEDGRYTLIE